MAQKLYTYKYGISSSQKLEDLDVELMAYKAELDIPDGGLGLAQHFKNIALMLWGPDSHEPFEWHPWAEKMNDVVHRHPITGKTRPHVGISGCASSGKSHYGGLFGIINWLCDPSNTYVFVTSTSLSESKHRIWKSICKLFCAVPGLPGKLIDSQGKICTMKDDGTHDDSSGIFLIAAAPSKEREAIGKLIGKKNKRVIFIADELPELSFAILEGFFGNLIANPIAQLVAMGNFKSRYDPFGEFVAPKDGYDTIGVDTDEWETDKGYCVRFDGMKSPNVLAARDIYPRIYGSKQLATHKRDFGENTAMFWRMCRSFESPVGMDNVIYSEADLSAGRVHEDPLWLSPPIKVSAMDPSFSSGGDKSYQIIGNYGQTTDGLWTIHLQHYLPVHEDASIRSPRDYQIARKFRDNCIAHGVSPENSAIDSTAAGSVLLSIIYEEWSNRVLGINFSGYGSHMLVTAADPVPAKDKFDRRVSELWWVGREFMKYNQIKGVNNDLARELKARRYETMKSADGLKMKVETKADMRARIGFSPDIADTFCLLIELCRQRFGALAGGIDTGMRRANTDWQHEVNNWSAVFENVSYEETEYATESETP